MSGILTHSPADILRHLLISRSIGTLPEDSSDWPIYAIRMPANPDNLICVYNTQGVIGGKHHVTKTTIERHGIQISIASASHLVGLAKANEICEVLDDTVYETLSIGTSQYRIHGFVRTSSILSNKTTNISKQNSTTVNFIMAVTQLS